MKGDLGGRVGEVYLWERVVMIMRWCPYCSFDSRKESRSCGWLEGLGLFYSEVG